MSVLDDEGISGRKSVFKIQGFCLTGRGVHRELELKEVSGTRSRPGRGREKSSRELEQRVGTEDARSPGPDK